MADKAPRKIKVSKRDGVWIVEPNGVGHCKAVMQHPTFAQALDDVHMICDSEQMLYNNRKRNT